MSTAYKPIIATICEAPGGARSPLPVLPDGPDGMDLFRFQDPSNLRRAIVPVFLDDDQGITRGMGTAFHIDGWGTFLTADHVVEPLRRWSKTTGSLGNEKQFTYTPRNEYPFLLLGMGLVYGNPAIPREARALISSIRSPIRERNSPLSELSGRPELEAASDVAVMQLAAAIPNRMVGSLPVRLSGWRPRCGDTVLALGFPQLDCEPLDEEAVRYLLSEGMFAAYGKVIAAHPDGLRSDPTPVIEVEATWPSGMSGGPVFSERGEVIGIVSRSWSDGNGLAACLDLMPWLDKWLPSIDRVNPGWRRGWAVLKNGTATLVALYRERDDALQKQTSLGEEYEVAFGSNRIGSDDFVTERQQ